MLSSSKWRCFSKDLSRLSAAMTALNMTQLFRLVSEETPCRDSSDCSTLDGYVCSNNRCCNVNYLQVCAPSYGNHGIKCYNDNSCYNPSDLNLVCATVNKTCKCRRGYVWEIDLKRCQKLGDDDYGPNKIGTVSDLIGTLIFILGVGAMMYLLLKLFCNCSKLWRRGNAVPRADIPRSEGDPQFIPMNNAPGTWVASYRVIGSLDHSPSSQFSGRNPSMPQYMLYPGAAPPPYEDALKHKVILSSYCQPPLSPMSLQQAQTNVPIESDSVSVLDEQTSNRPNTMFSEDSIQEQHGGTSSS
ncbi:Hypothetical predicted protein [Cloeon dipterum]|uniref:EB domain-containing protein n=1 Tax=Cloeon dipterum TaxID=197152 RepID=A0A8S1BSU8_9INSE|nr:Hypothetical predicted protein [Cloeon dipterum]